jgi:NDP-sugar pyrophosphorylase family protein
MKNALNKVDVLILCGGQGRRLRPVVNKLPKCLAGINNRPFLDIIIKKIARYGFKRVILCTGYKGAVIEKYYTKKNLPVEVVFSKESSPLGTGGALKNAKALIKSDPFLAVNGDTLCKINLKDFFAFHKKKRAMLSMALAKCGETRDFGRVIFDAYGRIADFREKERYGKGGFVNAGIYLMNKDIFAKMPKRARFSLERDLLPGILSGRCYGFLNARKLIDIGTPERYRLAQRLL